MSWPHCRPEMQLSAMPKHAIINIGGADVRAKSNNRLIFLIKWWPSSGFTKMNTIFRMVPWIIEHPHQWSRASSSKSITRLRFHQSRNQRYVIDVVFWREGGLMTVRDTFFHSSLNLAQVECPSYLAIITFVIIRGENESVSHWARRLYCAIIGGLSVANEWPNARLLLMKGPKVLLTRRFTDIGNRPRIRYNNHLVNSFLGDLWEAAKCHFQHALRQPRGNAIKKPASLHSLPFQKQ